jgi:hypothetical protein
VIESGGILLCGKGRKLATAEGTLQKMISQKKFLSAVATIN